MLAKLMPHAYELVLNLLSHKTIGQLRQLNMYHAEWIDNYFYSRFIGIITPFGIEASKMLRLLRKTKSIISGSAALLMLFPRTFKPSNLNIIVPPSFALTLMLKLCVRFNYKHIHTTSLLPYRQGLDTTSVHTFKHRESKLSIVVSVSRGPDPFKVILHYQSTHVMNAITPTGFACVYPQLTTNKLGLVNTSNTNLNLNGAWWMKQKDRGFKLEEHLGVWPEFDNHQCTTDPSCPRTARNFRDVHMMFLEFNIDEDHPSRHALHHYENNMVFSTHAACHPRRGREYGQQREAQGARLGYVYPTH